MSVTIDTDHIERNASNSYQAILSDASNVLAVGLATRGVEGVLEVLVEHDDPPSMRLLATESVLKEVVSNFTTAGTAADLVAADVLSLRTTENRFDGPLVCTDKAVISVVSTDSRTARLLTHDEEFVETAQEHYTSAWEDAERFSLRTPPLSRIHETLDEEFGPDVRTDFERMRAALDSARGDDKVKIDEVMISLLAAAKNEQLLYDISTWGEHIGLASRATFSRKKAAIEELGLIDTQKVPIDVGRPRLRLLLGDQRLREADADDLVNVVQSMLSTTRS